MSLAGGPLSPDMKNIFRPLFVLLAVLVLFPACEENIDEAPTFVNWKERNRVAFLQTLGKAKEAIAQAKARYGNDWEAHCDWRVFRTYAMSPEAQATAADSIAVHILQRGAGLGSPLYTDSALVNYQGRLIPNELSEDEESRIKGAVFDYSGLSRDSAMIFNPDFCSPVHFLVSSTAEGFTTAFMFMHVGDMWRVYMPQELAYGSSATKSIPAYSTLSFVMQLKGYSRAGTPLPAVGK